MKVSTLEYFNPVSKHYHAVEDFKKLSTIRKVAVVALTVFTAFFTLFTGTVPLFRYWVNLLHPHHSTPREYGPPTIGAFDLNKNFRADDYVAFANGEIVKASKTQAETSLDQFYDFLKETYGEGLTDRVFDRYELRKTTTLSWLKVRKAFTGIAANVTDQDLHHLHHALCQNNGTYKITDVLRKQNQELCDKISKKKFCELLGGEIHFLYSAFTRLKSVDVGSQDWSYRHDSSALERMGSWNKLHLKHPHMALGEFTGKPLSYLELKTGQVFCLPQISIDPQSPVFYRVAETINKNDGVIAHLFSPLNDLQAIYDPGQEYVFLAFRGTSFLAETSASGASVIRNTEPAGMGRNTYQTREVDIRNMLQQYLRRCTSSAITLHITGHSLGGCDAQRALVSVLEAIGSADDQIPWKKIKHIIATPQNAPKLELEISDELNEAVNKVDGQVTVELDHIRLHDNKREDLVQQIGDVLLAPTQPTPWFTTRIVNIRLHEDQGLVGGMLARHRYRPFNKFYCPSEFSLEILSAEQASEAGRANPFQNLPIIHSVGSSLVSLRRSFEKKR